MKYIELPIDDIVSRYKNGESAIQIANYYNVSKLLIQRRLRLANAIKLPGWSSKKYTVNETFFDIIDNEPKAYWLGIFLTDGNTSGGVRLNLQSGDEEHIKKFQSDISSNHPIRIISEGKQGTSCLHIGNKHLVKTLREKGIVPHNKRIYKVTEELEKHYWRGAIDGDGSIGYNKSFCISIVGTLETCDEFKCFCKKFIHTKANVSKDNNVYRFKLHGNIAMDVCHVLYNNATIYLERKYQKYIKLRQRAI